MLFRVKRVGLDDLPGSNVYRVSNLCWDSSTLEDYYDKYVLEELREVGCLLGAFALYDLSFWFSH
jgi:hypothetical protein